MALNGFRLAQCLEEQSPKALKPKCLALDPIAGPSQLSVYRFLASALGLSFLISNLRITGMLVAKGSDVFRQVADSRVWTKVSL